MGIKIISAYEYATRADAAGDIIYDVATERMYVVDDKRRWVRIGCYTDLEEKPDLSKVKPYPSNCVNCGAVLHGHICEYCGAENRR